MKGIQETAVRCISWVAVAGTIAVIGMGCAAKVNRDVLLSVKRVGILSITIDKMGTQTTDDEVMQSTVNYAARLYTDALSKRPEWKLLPLVYRDNADLRDFPGAPAAQNQPTGTLNKLIARVEEAYSVENWVKKERTRYLAASDMPILPYKVYGNVRETVITKSGRREAGEDWSAEQEEMRSRIGQLAAKLNLDGLIVIYLDTALSYMGDVEVRRGGRANGNIKMAATMTLISRNGKVAIDMGMPVMDDLTTNSSSPVYNAEGHASGITLGKRHNFPIDLKDPQGKVQKDLYALTDAAFRQFTKKLDKELGGK